jgi:AraC-like DNA-binding protein
MTGSSDGVITVDILNGFCKLVGQLGGNSAALIDEAGLPPTLGLVSGDKVPIRAVGELFEICARKLNCPDFGLRLAEMQLGCTVMKPLEKLISHARTIEQSLRCCIDHMSAYSSGLRLALLPVPGRNMQRLRIEILLDDYYAFPQLIEQLALLSHKTTMEMTGGFARARAISFSHTQIGTKWDYSRRFSIPVAFDQDFDEVLFADSDLQTSVIQYDENIFSSEYERISVQYPPTPLDTKARVAQAIRATLADSNCGREEVCAIIGVSSRTLHRQLARIGTNFERLRDEVRRNLCLRYLARSDLTITQVAGRLGFSEGSVLTHACQKWFAKSPRELRRHLLQ